MSLTACATVPTHPGMPRVTRRLINDFEVQRVQCSAQLGLDIFSDTHRRPSAGEIRPPRRDAAYRLTERKLAARDARWYVCCPPVKLPSLHSLCRSEEHTSELQS